MKDLVLIHGWGFDCRVWQPIADRLAGRCRVHFLAMPGYAGGNLAPDRIPDGATVCGWSLGGQVALDLALGAPRQVARLALVGTTPRFLQAADWPDAQPPSLLEDFAAAVAADDRGTLRRFAALINQGDAQARRLTRDMSALLDERLPAPEILAAGLDLLRDTDLRHRLAGVRQPTLILHGDADPLMPLAAGRWLAAQIPGARLEAFPGCAHAPFLSEPERFASVLMEFVDA